MYASRGGILQTIATVCIPKRHTALGLKAASAISSADKTERAHTPKKLSDTDDTGNSYGDTGQYFPQIKMWPAQIQPCSLEKNSSGEKTWSTSC